MESERAMKMGLLPLSYGGLDKAHAVRGVGSEVGNAESVLLWRRIVDR